MEASNLTDRTTQLILSSAVRESCLVRDDRDRSLTLQCTTPTTTRPLGRLSSPRGHCESYRLDTETSRPRLTCRILLLGLIGSFAQHYFHHIDVSYSCFDPAVSQSLTTRTSPSS